MLRPIDAGRSICLVWMYWMWWHLPPRCVPGVRDVVALGPSVSVEDADLAPDQALGPVGIHQGEGGPDAEVDVLADRHAEAGAEAEVRVPRRVLRAAQGGGEGAVLEGPAVELEGADDRHV